MAIVGLGPIRVCTAKLQTRNNELSSIAPTHTKSYHHISLPTTRGRNPPDLCDGDKSGTPNARHVRPFSHLATPFSIGNNDDLKYEVAVSGGPVTVQGLELEVVEIVQNATSALTPPRRITMDAIVCPERLGPAQSEIAKQFLRVYGAMRQESVNARMSDLTCLSIRYCYGQIKRRLSLSKVFFTPPASLTFVDLIRTYCQPWSRFSNEYRVPILGPLTDILDGHKVPFNQNDGRRLYIINRETLPLWGSIHADLLSDLEEITQTYAGEGDGPILERFLKAYDLLYDFVYAKGVLSVLFGRGCKPSGALRAHWVWSDYDTVARVNDKAKLGDSLPDFTFEVLNHRNIPEFMTHFLQNIVAWRYDAAALSKEKAINSIPLRATIIRAPCSTDVQLYPLKDLLSELYPQVPQLVQQFLVASDYGCVPSTSPNDKKMRRAVALDKWASTATFKGNAHSESVLMGLIEASKTGDFGGEVDDEARFRAHFKDRRSAIGTMTKCCWCCHWLSCELGIKTAGTHGIVYPWSPPTMDISDELLQQLVDVLTPAVRRAVERYMEPESGTPETLLDWSLVANSRFSKEH
ncbi:hypothetical protein AMATHDRAFT_6582 [Amanita thiersii Skay4041]|uniref:Uncharacterized protein n=1 Tax=Amanita thiersii Skay4041 TaxID=703135 RepID=A0A2A9NAH3_9AGAR|nr:hypothetical protein AMATHDRAFT_6582 [Amanita thiersii Skay4041]